MDKNLTLIIDFDSTFITVEALDTLAEIVLDGCKDKNRKIREICKTTKLGMEGKISFSESLSKRLSLFQPTKPHIQKLIKTLHRKITPSFKKNKDFLCRHKDNIYIISGGFKDYVTEVALECSALPSHVLANDFIYDETGKVLGFDNRNPLSRTNGKAEVVKGLGLTNKIVVLGDGYTDYEIKKVGAAEIFIAFTENVRRELVLKFADLEARSFDQVIEFLPRL